MTKPQKVDERVQAGERDVTIALQVEAPVKICARIPTVGSAVRKIMFDGIKSSLFYVRVLFQIKPSIEKFRPVK
ncbi:hypothetical protein EMIT093MI4_80180 [Pseudomonas sp. IT-93MI4]